MSQISFKLRAMAILWPAFLMAGVLEMLVFALVDPEALHGMGGAPVDWSPAAVYTAAFFVFWGVIATAGALTQLLELRPEDLNPPVGDACPRLPRGPGWPG